MITLPFASSEIRVDPEREEYIALRLKYQGMAVKAKKDFADQFQSRFKNMDQLFNECEGVAKEYLDGAIDEAIRDLVKNSIMDIDDEIFLNIYLSPRLSWNYDYAEISDGYFEIVLKAEQLDAYRAALRENRGSVMGGGFGLEGAAKGMVVAAAANVALDVIHELFDIGAKALSAMGDKQKKAMLYSDPHTLKHLSESIYRLTFQVHFALVHAINSRRENRLPLAMVSDEDAAKAKALFENVSKGRISGDNADNCLIQAIGLNPFDPELYYLWFNRHGDVDGQLEDLAGYFGVAEVSNFKHELVLRYKDGLRFSTPEECVSSLVDLEQYARSIGFKEIARERERIISLADRLDIERRTINGKLFETLESATLANNQWNEEQSRTVKGVVYPTHTEAEVARSKNDVSILLGAAILFFPPLAMQTYKSGYSRRARLIASLWVLFFLGISLLRDPLDLVGFIGVLVAFVIMGLVAMFIWSALGRLFNRIFNEPA